MDNINELADDTRAVLEDARDDASIREQRLEQADNAIQRADQERKQDAVLALLEEKIEALQTTRAGQNDARAALERVRDERVRVFARQDFVASGDDGVHDAIG